MRKSARHTASLTSDGERAAAAAASRIGKRGPTLFLGLFLGKLMIQYEKGIQHFERLVFEALTRNEQQEMPQ